MRIGYFIPEFPGQTHIFFWREIQELRARGVEISLVSTQLPAQGVISHTWAVEAQQQTTYLFPPKLQNIIGAMLELLRCGLKGWLHCAQAVLNAKGVSFSGRLRLVMLVIIGAEVSYIARHLHWNHLHAHSCADAANIAMFAQIISGLPYSLTLHGPIEDYGLNQEQKWSHAKLGIVITHKLYQEVYTQLGDYLPPKVVIAPMGVDCTIFQRSTPYVPWSGDGVCRIFSCGRLNLCKGHADLITAIALVKSRGMNVQLIIAGEDEQGGSGYHQQLQALIEELSASDFVQLLGAVSEETIRQHLEKAHMFVLASLNEPLGVAIMEAMAMEIPVVITKAGGVQELVDEGIDGLFVEPQNPDQLAEAIIKLLTNPELASRLAETGRQKIVQYFHSRRSVEVLLEGISP